MPRITPFRTLAATTLTGGALFLGACGDTPASTAPESLAAEQAANETRTAQMARNVAVALADPAVRAALHQAMKESPVREGKLDLQSYVRSAAGASLLQRMARAGQRSPEKIAGEIRALPALEIYLPVAKHREQWTGGSELLVAAQLTDDAALTGYDLAGGPVHLSTEAAPAAPVLVMTARERWRPRLAPGAEGPLRNTDCGPYAVTECPDDGTGGGGGGTPIPKGLYMTALNLNDVGEPWTRGDPEIEVMARSTSGGDMAPVTCLGETASGLRRFNQDSNNWSGRVLIVTDAEAQAGRGYNHAFDVWEDDTDPCETRTDVNMNDFYRHARDTGIALGVIILDVRQGDQSYCNDNEAAELVCLAAFLAPFGQMVWSGVMNLIGANDDFLGAAALRSNPTLSGQTLEVRRGADAQVLNGTMKVQWMGI